VTGATDTSVTFTDPGGAVGSLAIVIIPQNNSGAITAPSCAYRHGTLNITADDKSINYGQATPTFTKSVAGLRGSDAVASVTYSFEGKDGTSYGPSPTPPTNAGVYRIYPGSVSLSPGTINNYDVNYYEGTFTIAGIPSTVTATS